MISMKLVLIVVTVELCQGVRIMSLPGLRNYHEECAKKTGLTISVHMPKGQWKKREPNMEPSHEIKCFRKCLLEKAGYLNETGSIVMSEDKLPMSFNATACLQKVIDDKCEMAYQTERCLMQQMHQGRNIPRGNPYRQIYEHRNTCIAELKLDLKPISPGNMDVSNDTKCLQKCMLEKAGLLGKDGQIQEDTWPRRGNGRIVQECQQIKENNKCQEAHLKNLCMMELNGPHNFMASVKMYEIDQNRDKCMMELKLNTTNYPLFRPPQPPGRYSGEPTKEVKCLERCVMIKAGYLSEDNKLVEKKWNLNDDVDVDRCTSIDEDDVCQESYLIQRCLQDEKMEAWRDRHRQRNMGFYN